jgi:hypothetical protein
MDKKIISNLDPKQILLQADQASERKSAFEAENFSEENLDSEARRNEHHRTESSRNILSICNLVVLIVLYLVCIAGILTLGYHLVCPVEYHFVSIAQLDTIRTLLFSALATSFAKELHKKAYKS